VTEDDGCFRPVFRRPAVTVDGAVLVRRPHHGGKVRCFLLLIERKHDPFAGQWALPGGFVEYGEDIEAAAHREVAEETGLAGLPLRQFRTFGAPDRDPRGHTISVVYVAELVGEPPQVAGADDAARAAWFDVDELPPLAFDHAQIVRSLLYGLGVRF
jgi:8-oxo-dGTP diphosphatase